MQPSFIGYAKLMRFHKTIGIWLLLWPTLWALWLASAGKPSVSILIIFILGAIVMRAAGCVINDIADRHFDAHVARTCDRPLVTGQVTVRQAVILFLMLCIFALLLVLQLNIFTIKLAFVGLLLAIIYPFMKRFTYLPQLFLGAAFAWSVPMAFAAQTGRLPAIAWLIYLVAVLWPVAYDTMYAMVDRADDLKIGIKSTAILFGQYDCLIIGILQLSILLLLVAIGKLSSLSFYYYLSLLIVGALSVYQQYLLKNREPKNCFRAFRNNYWVGLVIFLGIFLGLKI